MPRLCILVHDLSATGVVRNAIALSRHFAGSMQVRLVTINGGGVLEKDVDPRVALVGLSGDPIARLLGLRRLLRDGDVDLMLSAGNRGHLFGCLASAGLAGLRRIYRLSNSLSHAREGGGPGRRARSLGRWFTLSCIGRQADLLIANSPTLMAEINARGPVRARRALIPNGVDVSAIRRRAAEPAAEIDGRRAGVPLALAVGRLVEQKNHETLIDALAIANRARAVDLAILGGGAAAARQALEARARAAGVADRLRFLPPSPNPFAIMRQADLFVMPSWWEGSSNALLEAVACGLPVVASDRAGNAQQVLGFGRHGLLVDPRDAEGMAAAMLMQLGDDAILPGDRAWDFDVSDMLERYAALVREVLASRPRAAFARPGRTAVGAA